MALTQTHMGDTALPAQTNLSPCTCTCSIPRPAVVIEELDAGVPVTGLGALLTGTSSSAGAPARTHGQQQGSTTPLSEDSTLSSEGAQADYVIEQATLLNTSSMGKAGAAQQPAAGYLQQQQQLDDLLRITSRMLRRWAGCGRAGLRPSGALGKRRSAAHGPHAHAALAGGPTAAFGRLADFPA